MNKMHEELAIIKDVGYGNRDVGSPVLWFTVTFLNGGSLQILQGEDAYNLIKESGVYDVKSLEGKACVISTDGYRVEFVRLHK